jgi:hypothetical protein
MSAGAIAKALGGRRSGSGWMARCPAHRDNNPSLSLRDANGRTLVHCFSGCTQDEVIAALRKLGLWPERQQQNWTPAERRAYGRRRFQAERLARGALQWRSAMAVRWEQAKVRAYARYLSHPDERTEVVWAEAARQLVFYQTLKGAALMQQFRDAVKPDAAAVKRLIAQARKDAAHANRCTALVVAVLAIKSGDAT